MPRAWVDQKGPLGGAVAGAWLALAWVQSGVMHGGVAQASGWRDVPPIRQIKFSRQLYHIVWAVVVWAVSCGLYRGIHS